MQKQIDVTCPCCATVLTIDVLTAKVLRQAQKSEVDETGKAVLDLGRWDSAKDTIAGRGAKSQDVFDSALSKEKTRDQDLGDLYDKARAKLERRKEEAEKELEGEG